MDRALAAETTALEYAKAAIQMNVVYPGLMQTAMLEGDPHVPPLVLIVCPAQPEEIAEAVLWLCSDAPSRVIGISRVLSEDTLPPCARDEYHREGFP